MSYSVFDLSSHHDTFGAVRQMNTIFKYTTSKHKGLQQDVEEMDRKFLFRNASWGVTLSVDDMEDEDWRECCRMLFNSTMYSILFRFNRQSPFGCDQMSFIRRLCAKWRFHNAIGFSRLRLDHQGVDELCQLITTVNPKHFLLGATNFRVSKVVHCFREELMMLSLNNVNMDQEEFQRMCDNLAERCPNLVELTLYDNQVVSICPLKRVLDKCKNITSIRLDGNPLRDDDCDADLFSRETGTHANLYLLSIKRSKIETRQERVFKWIRMHKSKRDVKAVMAFASRRVTMRCIASVSRLFPDVDRLVGSFLIGSE